MAFFGFGRSGGSDAAVREALGTIMDRYTGQTLAEAKAIREIDMRGAEVGVHLRLGYPAAGYVPALAQEVGERLSAVPGVTRWDVSVDWKIEAHGVQAGLKRLPEVRNIVAVASGKGGVGKSTTAVNLALALHAEGARVGLLDADIYGPSQPQMLGAHEKPQTLDGKHFEPVMAHGLQSMSIGYLIEEDNPMIWRGPMVTSALQQLLNDTRWSDLDYLIVDMPPGTGDIQLTLSQKVPVAGAVIVTTPQDIALLDARKGLKMFEKVNVPVLGVIENMSLHVCSQCGHVEPIFGEGGGERMAQGYGVPFLGGVPLDRRIREQVDGGHPTLVSEPDGEISRRYREMARKLGATLSLRAKDYSSLFPRIVVQND
jgi:ATP-binding protein involved in chromosome partitioning